MVKLALILYALLLALAAAAQPNPPNTEPAPRGPLMTDAQFFAALGLGRPELAAVKTAAEKGDLAAAKHAYAQYLRARPKPVWYFDWRAKPTADRRPAAPNTSQADRALAHEYNVTAVPLKFEGAIDWRANPTKTFDPEWTWQFGRHDWWPALGRAYWETGDEKYAREWLWELRSWIADNPLPPAVANGVGSRWRTIECGIRLAGSWPEAFYRFLSSSEFSDDDVVTMVKSLVEQARYLLAHPTTGNWLTMEANGMGHVGVLFPEFREAATWRDTAIARLYAELDKQVYPDGAQVELSTGYHFVALRNFLGLANVARLNDVAMPADYVGKLERMYACGMWAMRPDRNLPPLNDAWDVNVPGILAEGFGLFPQRHDFQWIATEGESGTPPDHTSHWFPWAGWAVMRSGWGRDDKYLLFDVGPFGYGHQHEDKLAFVLSAYGANLVIDTGSYRYDTSPMRAYVLSPWAHNTVLVDDKGQNRRRLHETDVNRAPQTNPWYTSPAADYCEGAYDDGFGQQNALKVAHKRQVLFVKPDYWIVLDTLAPADGDPHEYTSLFHLGTPDAEVGEKGAVTTLNPTGANLQILALPWTEAPVTADIVKGQERPVLLGWVGKHGVGNAHPIPVARYKWQQAGVTRLGHVLCPIRAGQKSPIAAIEPLQAASGSALVARIVFTDGRTDTAAINLDPDKPFRVDTLTSSRLATVLRKDAAGKTVTQITVPQQSGAK